MNGQFYAHVEMLTGVDNIFQYYCSVGLLNPGVSVLYVELQFVQLIRYSQSIMGDHKFNITFT